VDTAALSPAVDDVTASLVATVTGMVSAVSEVISLSLVVAASVIDSVLCSPAIIGSCSGRHSPQPPAIGLTLSFDRISAIRYICTNNLDYTPFNRSCRSLSHCYNTLIYELDCGPMPNVMAALPNIGAPSVQRRKVWLTPTTRVPCSNSAKTRNPLKLAGVPQTHQQISAVSRPMFTLL